MTSIQSTQSVQSNSAGAAAPEIHLSDLLSSTYLANYLVKQLNLGQLKAVACSRDTLMAVNLAFNMELPQLLNALNTASPETRSRFNHVHLNRPENLERLAHLAQVPANPNAGVAAGPAIPPPHAEPQPGQLLRQRLQAQLQTRLQGGQ